MATEFEVNLSDTFGEEVKNVQRGGKVGTPSEILVQIATCGVTDTRLGVTYLWVRDFFGGGNTPL